MAKDLFKKLKTLHFLEIFYTLKVMQPSLTGLSKNFQSGATNVSKIVPNVIKILTKTKN